MLSELCQASSSNLVELDGCYADHYNESHLTLVDIWHECGSHFKDLKRRPSKLEYVMFCRQFLVDRGDIANEDYVLMSFTICLPYLCLFCVRINAEWSIIYVCVYVCVCGGGGYEGRMVDEFLANRLSITGWYIEAFSYAVHLIRLIKSKPDNKDI